jgi:anthranilate phosphoribosyltransferase
MNTTQDPNGALESNPDDERSSSGLKMGEFTPKEAIKKVGRGKTLSQDLTEREARVAFEALCDQRFSPVQFGAFLQALRIKELTQTELNALYAVVQARLQSPNSESKMDLTLNLASDTGRKGGLLSLLAAQVLSFAGLRISVLRSEPVLSRNRESYQGTRQLRPQGAPLTELPMAALLPRWSEMDAIRGELGFRSCLHTVEKMVNPYTLAPLVFGISHRHYADRMAMTLQAHGQNGCIVLGNHGTPDLVLHKPTEMVLVAPEAITTLWVDPANENLRPDPGIYSLNQFKQWPIWFEQGWPQGFEDALILQTAALGLVVQPEKPWKEALSMATGWVHAWKQAQ